MNSDISISPWLDGKRWVYSITFDEALVELHRFALQDQLLAPILNIADVRDGGGDRRV